MFSLIFGTKKFIHREGNLPFAKINTIYQKSSLNSVFVEKKVLFWKDDDDFGGGRYH